LGFFTSFVEEVWFWGEMTLLDSILYFFNTLFHFGEWQSIRFFSSSLGLRRGDPLLPFLFVIVMEALSRMFSATINGSFLSGLSIGSRQSSVVNISHMFAGDTSVFVGAKPNNFCYLHALFLCFKVVSGLKINMAKSKLVLVGNVDNMDGLASILGCGVSSLRLKYLGLPLRAF
jgi:hypothetical protein